MLLDVLKKMENQNGELYINIILKKDATQPHQISCNKKVPYSTRKGKNSDEIQIIQISKTSSLAKMTFTLYTTISCKRYKYELTQILYIRPMSEQPHESQNGLEVRPLNELFVGNKNTNE